MRHKTSLILSELLFQVVSKTRKMGGKKSYLEIFVFCTWKFSMGGGHFVTTTTIVKIKKIIIQS